MPEQRRRFSPQFKAEAVQMVIETGKPVAEVARDLGVNDGTLGNWVKAWRDANPEPDKSLSPVERARVSEMEAEIRRLRMENEFLKKGRFRVFRGFGLVLTRWSAAVSGCARHRVVPPSAGTGSSVGGGSGRAVSSRRACGCVGATSRPDSLCLPGLRYAAAGL